MAFATTDDVAARLERATLTAEQLADATMLLDVATAAIAEVVDKDEAWAAALDPVPALLKGLTVDLVCRAMGAAQGLISASETLGAHTRSETYNRDGSSAVVLTDQEALVARRVVHGNSVTVVS